MLNRKKMDRPRFAWDEDWKHVERHLCAVAHDVRDKSWLHQRRQPEETLAPCEVALIENGTSLVFGADWTERLVLQGFARGETDKAAEKLEQAINGIVAKQRKELTEEAEKKPPQGAALRAHRFTMDLLGTARTARTGSGVTWRAEGNGSLLDLLGGLASDEKSKP